MYEFHKMSFIGNKIGLYLPFIMNKLLIKYNDISKISKKPLGGHY